MDKTCDQVADGRMFIQSIATAGLTVFLSMRGNKSILLKVSDKSID
jgi:hypothetical protein